MKKEFYLRIIFPGIFIPLFSIASYSQPIHWQETNIPSGNPIKYLESNSSGDIFASRVGEFNTGVIYRTTDMGNTWTLQINGLLPSFSHVLAVNSNDIIFAGGLEGINYSTDNGNNWLAAAPIVAGVVALDIDFNDDIYFSGNIIEGGDIYKSTDNGNSWILINNGLQNYWVNDIAFSLDGYIYVAAFKTIPNYTGRVFYSIDEGANWIPSSIELNNQPNNIVVNNNGDIYTSLYSHDIYRSTNHGATWQLVSNTIFNIADMKTNQLGHIFVSAYGYGVFRSTNNGDSWEPVNEGLTSLNIGSLTVDPFGFIYTGNGGLPGSVFRTTETSLPVELISFTAEVDKNNVLLKWITATEINNHGFEIERKQSGIDWAKIGFVQGNGTTIKENVYNYTDENLRAREYIYRLKQIDYDGSFEYSSELNVLIENPYDFNLEQNYPNPFNPTTTINYSIKKDGSVTLKVYDIIGKEVVALVNENKTAGNYSVQFNASNLPSGIYFYQIESGSFSSTKKLILLK